MLCETGSGTRHPARLNRKFAPRLQRRFRNSLFCSVLVPLQASQTPQPPKPPSSLSQTHPTESFLVNGPKPTSLVACPAHHGLPKSSQDLPRSPSQDPCPHVQKPCHPQLRSKTEYGTHPARSPTRALASRFFSLPDWSLAAGKRPLDPAPHAQCPTLPAVQAQRQLLASGSPRPTDSSPALTLLGLSPAVP